MFYLLFRVILQYQYAVPYSLFFSFPGMQLGKWLSVHQGDADLLERQMVVQQVANTLADIHGCGSADKLSLCGRFVGELLFH